MESRIVDRGRKVNQDRAGVIEKPYNVTSRDVEGLFVFTQPLRTVEEVIPGGGANGQGGHGEIDTINIGSYEAVRSREVAFAFKYWRSHARLHSCAAVLHALIGRGLSTIAFKISRGASKHGKYEDNDVMSHEYIAGLRREGVKNARSNINNNGKHGCQ